MEFDLDSPLARKIYTEFEEEQKREDAELRADAVIAEAAAEFQQRRRERLAPFDTITDLIESRVLGEELTEGSPISGYVSLNKSFPLRPPQNSGDNVTTALVVKCAYSRQGNVINIHWPISLHLKVSVGRAAESVKYLAIMNKPQEDLSGMPVDFGLGDVSPHHDHSPALIPFPDTNPDLKWIIGMINEANEVEIENEIVS